MARVRRVPGTQERLAASRYSINDPHNWRGHWHDLYPQQQPLIIEIGSGRGRWLYHMAKAHPENNYLGVDVVPEIIMDAIDEYGARTDTTELIRFLWLDAEHLDEIFAPGEVSDIYLHFSDPWPKKRHAKRRLTHRGFLDIYQYILADTGKVHFKTDSQDFFTFALEEFEACGWRLEDVTRDLYANLPEDNIATEYERRFHKRGLPICHLCAYPPHKA